MKILFALSILPALSTSSLLNLRSVTKTIWPEWRREKRVKPTPTADTTESQPVAPLSYHSLMINGARHYMAKHYALALAHYRRALSIHPDDVTALSGEAWSLYHLGQAEQAAKDFQALLQMDANDSWAREGMALCSSGHSSTAAAA